MIKDKPYYTQEEIAEIFGVTIYTVRKWRGTGKLGFMRVGKVVRIDKASLNMFMLRYSFPSTKELATTDDPIAFQALSS